jgi:hypothetical protein
MAGRKAQAALPVPPIERIAWTFRGVVCQGERPPELVRLRIKLKNARLFALWCSRI